MSSVHGHVEEIGDGGVCTGSCIHGHQACIVHSHIHLVTR